MANTENIEAKLCAYVDGDLDPAGCAEIEQHLATNPQHRQLMVELREQRELLRGLPRAKAPEDMLESVQTQLERSVLLDLGAAGGTPFYQSSGLTHDVKTDTFSGVFTPCQP